MDAALAAFFFSTAAMHYSNSLKDHVYRTIKTMTIKKYPDQKTGSYSYSV